jgi:hypothetical protein
MLEHTAFSFAEASPSQMIAFISGSIVHILFFIWIAWLAWAK